MSSLPLVLVIDDEVRSQEAIRRVLEDEFDIISASNASEAEKILESEFVQIILCDQRMPGQNGVDFLKQVRERWPEPIRMIISGYTDSSDIIAGVNEAGIHRYLTKPWKPEDLIAAVSEAAKQYELFQQDERLSSDLKATTPTLTEKVSTKAKALKSKFGFDTIIHAEESPLSQICQTARKISPFDISVLLTGESGTGKELLARLIHYSSHRADKPFVVENCGALPDQLLESELFGSKKGAFTGAYEDRIGLFEQADGGTIFLDEIGETSLAFQVKLLRVLQEGEIRPLGGTRRRKVNVRLISATNRNLDEEIKAGRFRSDLFYRLSTFPLHLPPLRERPCDIAPLVEHFLATLAPQFGRQSPQLSALAKDKITAYPWPGNVRELVNELQKMLALSEGDALSEAVLSPHIAYPSHSSQMPKHAFTGTLKDHVEKLEEEIIKDAFTRNRRNLSQTATELGLSRVGLRNKLKRYGLNVEE